PLAAPGAGPAEPARRGWWRRGRDRTAPAQAQADRIPPAPAGDAPIQPTPAAPPPATRVPAPRRPVAPAAVPQAYLDRARPLPPPPPGKKAKKRRKGHPAPSAWQPPHAGTSLGARPLPPPQAGTRPGARPLPPPPRRKRRWGRRLFTTALLGALCCCGVPGYFLWPAAQQYPVSAVLPSHVADLDLREDAAGRRATERLAEQAGGTSLISSGDPFAGVYADGNGKRVTVFGATGLRLTPESDVEAELTHLSDTYRIEDVQAFDLGEAGVHERCGVGRDARGTVVVCAWADHGSLATVLLTRRSVDESAELTGTLRQAILVRK
ncbi:hypothetical protein ACFOHP_33705, partial [Couchioplanes caeruleus subsp. azureus]